MPLAEEDGTRRGHIPQVVFEPLRNMAGKYNKMATQTQHREGPPNNNINQTRKHTLRRTHRHTGKTHCYLCQYRQVLVAIVLILYPPILSLSNYIFILHWPHLHVPPCGLRHRSPLGRSASGAPGTPALTHNGASTPVTGTLGLRGGGTQSRRGQAEEPRHHPCLPSSGTVFSAGFSPWLELLRCEGAETGAEAL